MPLLGVNDLEGSGPAAGGLAAGDGQAVGGERVGQAGAQHVAGVGSLGEPHIAIEDGAGGGWRSRSTAMTWPPGRSTRRVSSRARWRVSVGQFVPAEHAHHHIESAVAER